MMKRLFLYSLFALSGIACAMDNPAKPELIATRVYLWRLNHKGDMLAFARNSLAPLKVCSVTSEGKVKDVSFELPRNPVVAIDFDHSDRYLATCNCSNIVSIFSTENGERLASVDVSVDALRISFSPKTGYLAYSGPYGTVGIAKIAELGAVEEGKVFKNRNGFPATLSFDSTGNNLIISHLSPGNAVTMYDIESGIDKWSFPSQRAGCVTPMCIDQENNRLAFPEQDAGKIGIYDLNALTKIKELSYDTTAKGNDLNLKTMNFDSTGRSLAVVLSNGRDEKIVVYDVAAEKIVHEYSNELGRNIIKIIPMPTGKHIAVLCENDNSYMLTLS